MFSGCRNFVPDPLQGGSAALRKTIPEYSLPDSHEASASLLPVSVPARFSGAATERIIRSTLIP
jgi:hypothetical protein